MDIAAGKKFGNIITFQILFLKINPSFRVCEAVQGYSVVSLLDCHRLRLRNDGGKILRTLVSKSALVYNVGAA